MDEELVRAKYNLYQELLLTQCHKELDDVETAVLQLLENDIHIKMKKEGRLPWIK